MCCFLVFFWAGICFWSDFSTTTDQHPYSRPELHKSPFSKAPPLSSRRLGFPSARILMRAPEYWKSAFKSRARFYGRADACESQRHSLARIFVTWKLDRVVGRMRGKKMTREYSSLHTKPINMRGVKVDSQRQFVTKSLDFKFNFNKVDKLDIMR